MPEETKDSDATVHFNPGESPEETARRVAEAERLARDAPADDDDGGDDATVRLRTDGDDGDADAASDVKGGIRSWINVAKVEAKGDAPESTVIGVTLDPLAESARVPPLDQILQTLDNLLERDDRLTIQRELARGGMGVINITHDRSLQRKVAMKVLHGDLLSDAGMLKAFLREAQVLGQLDHPNIVPIYEFGKETGEDSRPFFLMKLVEGVTLTQLIKSLPKRALSMPELHDTLEVMVKICDALAFAHSRGVIHLDLKPANIMVGEFGQVYLMDWGVAKLTHTAPDIDEQANVSRVGWVTGTPSHMSPEQARGENLDARTDVFAIGAVLFHIVARKAPYTGKSAIEALLAASQGQHKTLREVAPEGRVPGELDRIIKKAMAIRPDDRYQSISDLRDDLVRFMRGGSEFAARHYRKGDHIIVEGELGDAAFIIEKGACEVYKVFDGERRSLRIMKAGEVFGETAVLTSQPRTASVVAMEPTILRVVTKAVLDEEVNQMKTWMGALVRTLADRFREREQQRAETRAVATERELARLALMHATAFGELGEDGALRAQWAPFEGLLDSLLSRARGDWQKRVGDIDGIEVHCDQDILVIADPADLRHSLES